ncbi:MAG: DUF3422 domain-containing protein [Salinarimonas sp.]|nr:DUF3422 domain-containing protein [Salinarimonas sp.]
MNDDAAHVCDEALMPQFRQHPLRGRLLGEMHARPFAPLSAPHRVIHLAFMTDEEAAVRARARLVAWCEARGIPAPAESARHHRAQCSGVALRFESHSEFTTYTWEFPGNGGGGSGPDAHEPAPDKLARVMEGLQDLQAEDAASGSGLLMVAIDLNLHGGAADLKSIFGEANLAMADVEGGAARIVTDFRADAHGFVRIVVEDHGLTPGQGGALVQRLLEIETYRTMTLLGLPEAQGLAPTLRRIETTLPGLLEEMRRSTGFNDNRRLLDTLTALAAELESDAAGSLYRFGATRAYGDLVRLRLEAIAEKPVPGHDSWSSFLDRRLQPAIRTCLSTEERQANLSRKLSRAAQLLRARVDVELESQNSNLLKTMNARARTQLRLQQTVEGLSVAAITYYISGLLHRGLTGASDAGYAVDPTIVTAAAIPVILIAIALLVRRIRRAHDDGAG